jgi:hypothetical protein
MENTLNSGTALEINMPPFPHVLAVVINKKQPSGQAPEDPAAIFFKSLLEEWPPVLGDHS